jgi:hypothetical protein
VYSSEFRSTQTACTGNQKQTFDDYQCRGRRSFNQARPCVQAPEHELRQKTCLKIAVSPWRGFSWGRQDFLVRQTAGPRVSPISSCYRESCSGLAGIYANTYSLPVDAGQIDAAMLWLLSIAAFNPIH